MIRRGLFPLAAAAILAAVSASACRHLEWHNTPPIIGEQPGQLELRIAGEHRNKIEAFFYNQGDLELFETIDPPSSDNTSLQFGKTIIVPRNGAYGTFAVIYGNRREKITAFGWQSGKIKLERYELTHAGQHIRAEWVTPRILRVECEREGSGHEVHIIEFQPVGDQAWKVLSANNASATQ